MGLDILWNERWLLFPPPPLRTVSLFNGAVLGLPFRAGGNFALGDLKVLDVYTVQGALRAGSAEDKHYINSTLPISIHLIISHSPPQVVRQ